MLVRNFSLICILKIEFHEISSTKFGSKFGETICKKIALLFLRWRFNAGIFAKFTTYLSATRFSELM